MKQFAEKHPATVMLPKTAMDNHQNVPKIHSSQAVISAVNRHQAAINPNIVQAIHLTALLIPEPLKPHGEKDLRDATEAIKDYFKIYVLHAEVICQAATAGIMENPTKHAGTYAFLTAVYTRQTNGIQIVPGRAIGLQETAKYVNIFTLIQVAVLHQIMVHITAALPDFAMVIKPDKANVNLQSMCGKNSALATCKQLRNHKQLVLCKF
jgi:hypothetical protein